MALAGSVTDRNIEGKWRRHAVDVTFDSSYPTGGEAYTAGLFGLSRIEHLEIASGGGGYVIQDDATNSKLLAYEAGADGGALDEVANTTDLSSVTARVIAVGT